MVGQIYNYQTRYSSRELSELGWLLVPCCVEIEMGHILLVLRQTKLFLSDWNEIEYKVGNYQL